MTKKPLIAEQKEEILSLIQNNKIRLTAYIRSQYRDLSDSDIEDCFQNLFIRAYDKHNSFQKSPNKTGWIFRAMRNVVREFCRKKTKYSQKFLPLSANEDTDNEFIDENDMIFEITTNHLSEDQLATLILSRLNETEQKIYRLRFIEKLHTDEIAKRLGLPSGTVRGRLSDLKKRITATVHSNELIKLIQENNFSKNFEHFDQSRHI